MKTNIHYNKVKALAFLPFYLFTFLLLASCDDYLTEESKSSLNTDNFYQTDADKDQALTGVYGCLKPLSTYYFAMSELRSDNMFEIQEAKANAYADCSQFNTSALLNNSIVANCWANYYTLIASANTLLDHNPSTQVTAEARFLRGLAYFDLVRFFGHVPVSLHELAPAESFSLKQSEVADVYKNVIVPDLRYAVDNLTDVATDYLGNTHTERATKTAAKALLGKVYLTMAGYPLNDETKKDSAQILFHDVLQSAGALTGTPTKYWAKTSDEWNRMWLHENDNKYFIFEIQYICDKNQGNPMTPLTRTSNTQADAYCNGNLTVGPHVYIDRDLQQHFLDTISSNEFVDKRTTGTINMAMTYDEETGTYIGGAQDANNFLVKFFENKIKRANLGVSDMDATIVDRTYWPQNFPLIRLEDIMLLYAECVGPTDEGYNCLNQIRTRAGLQALSGLSNDAFQQAVKNERRYELLGEGQRWFDEVRQNTFVNDLRTEFINYRDNYDAAHSSVYTTYANRVNQNMYLYPIPLGQMEVHEGLYTQNPGY